MSKYTTNFKTLINMGIYSKDELKAWFTDYELTDFLTADEIDIINSRGTWSKEKLAERIIDEYYFRDLGFETPAMFKHYAKVKMLDIMESKLPLIYSASIEYDPLVNVNYHETLTRNVKGSAASTGLNIASDTPQGNINKADILNGSYASQTSADENSGSTNEDETYDKHVIGNSGVSATAQAMVKQYRDNIRAIDYEIIKEMNELFMGLF